MRRWLCALQIGVLASVLCPAVAFASFTDAFAPQQIDLSAQLFARCFGESSERQASFNAVASDAMAETSLRGLAFRVDVSSVNSVVARPARLPLRNANLSDPAFAPPAPLGASIADMGAQLRVPSVEYYESANPIPTDAPATHRFDLTNLQVSAAQADDFAAPLQATSSQPQGASVTLPVRVGKLRFSPHAEAAAQTESAQTNFENGTLGAGATLNVRAGSRNLGVDLSSALEHATLTAPQFSATGSAPSVGLTGDALPVFVPAYADVSAQTVSTGLTVPVTRSLTANLQYGTQHLLGAYGLPGVSNLDADNTVYGAKLTFNMPKGMSAISLSASQYHFQDNLVPANALTTTNANVNFTIKF